MLTYGGIDFKNLIFETCETLLTKYNNIYYILINLIGFI